MNNKSKLVGYLVLVVSLAVWAYFIYRFYIDPRETFWMAFTILLVLVIGILHQKFRPGKEIITAEGVKNFLKALFWLYFNIGIAQISRALFQFAEATSLTRFQISLLVAWGLLLFGELYLLSIENYREKFFAWVRRNFGGWALYWFFFTLLYVAPGFFGSVTYMLVKIDILPWTPVNQEITSSQVSNFYLWHFVDAIPLLKVNSTLRWQEPLTYDNGGIGFLLLLFKIVVISPVIASFIWYRQFVAKEKKVEPPKGKAQKIVYRIVHPKRRTIHP